MMLQGAALVLRYLFWEGEYSEKTVELLIFFGGGLIFEKLFCSSFPLCDSMLRTGISCTGYTEVN